MKKLLRDPTPQTLVRWVPVTQWLAAALPWELLEGNVTHQLLFQKSRHIAQLFS